MAAFDGSRMPETYTLTRDEYLALLHKGTRPDPRVRELMEAATRVMRDAENVLSNHGHLPHILLTVATITEWEETLRAALAAFQQEGG